MDEIQTKLDEFKQEVLDKIRATHLIKDGEDVKPTVYFLTRQGAEWNSAILPIPDGLMKVFSTTGSGEDEFVTAFLPSVIGALNVNKVTVVGMALTTDSAEAMKSLPKGPARDALIFALAKKGIGDGPDQKQVLTIMFDNVFSNKDEIVVMPYSRYTGNVVFGETGHGASPGRFAEILRRIQSDILK